MTAIRALFVNENIGGHATVHHHLRAAMSRVRDLSTTFVDVPEPSVARRLAALPVPGLAALDIDLQPLRSQLALSAWVRRELRRRRGTYDVLHVYTQNSALLAADILAETPSIVSLDTTTARNAYRLPYRQPGRFTPVTVRASKPFEQRVFGAARRVVANSEWAATSLRDDYGVREPKLVVLPFGISAPGVVATSRIGPVRIVFVGRQFEAKGGRHLLEAYASRLADRSELLLVTQESVPPIPGVTVRSDLRQGDGRLWDILASAQIMAFPSAIDQAPNAVLEGMAAGLPVVAVDTAAVGEMVVDGETGFLVAAGDTVGLGDRLARLVDDEGLRRSMGAAGRRRFERFYDVEQSASRLAELLLEVVQ